MSDSNPASEQADRFPRIRGYCPRCDGETLFVGEGGYVTCSLIGCEEPDAAHKLLMKGSDYGEALSQRVTDLEAELAAARAAQESAEQHATRLEGRDFGPTTNIEGLIEEMDKRGLTAWTESLHAFFGSMGAAYSVAAYVEEKERADKAEADLKQRDEALTTLLRWCDEDGGAIKGYLAHADVRHLLASRTAPPPAAKPAQRVGRSGFGVTKVEPADETTDG